MKKLMNPESLEILAAELRATREKQVELESRILIIESYCMSILEHGKSIEELRLLLELHDANFKFQHHIEKDKF